MDLARELGMTKRMLLNNIDSMEIEEWILYFKEVNQKDSGKQSPQQIEGQLRNVFMGKMKRR